MIRTALKPAWLALLALLVVVVVAFYQLGMWQLGVSSNKAARELAQAQAARPVEDLEQVVGPHEAFPRRGAGLPIRAEGEYVVEDQFLVPDRLLDGAAGYWVVTPLRTDASGTSALLPVVRGFVTDPEVADRPASAQVRVAGTLAPSEHDAGAPLPPGQRGAIDTADLVNVWQEPLYNGFIFLTEEEPRVTGSTVQRVPPPVFGEGGINPRNVGYALQWFVFALFAVYMYVRFLHQAAKPRATDPAAQPDPHPTPPGEPA